MDVEAEAITSPAGGSDGCGAYNVATLALL